MSSLLYLICLKSCNYLCMYAAKRISLYSSSKISAKIGCVNVIENVPKISIEYAYVHNASQVMMSLTVINVFCACGTRGTQRCHLEFICVHVFAFRLDIYKYIFHFQERAVSDIPYGRNIPHKTHVGRQLVWLQDVLHIFTLYSIIGTRPEIWTKSVRNLKTTLWMHFPYKSCSCFDPTFSET